MDAEGVWVNSEHCWGVEVLRPGVALRPTIGGPSVESGPGMAGPCLTQFLLELLPLLSQPLEWSPRVCQFLSGPVL